MHRRLSLFLTILALAWVQASAQVPEAADSTDSGIPVVLQDRVQYVEDPTDSTRVQRADTQAVTSDSTRSAPSVAPADSSAAISHADSTRRQTSGAAAPRDSVRAAASPSPADSSARPAGADSLAATSDSAGAVGDSVAAADSLAATSDSAGVAGDSVAVADSSSGDTLVFPFQFPPIISIHRGMFYGTKSEMDLERGVVVTRETIGGIPSGPGIVQSVDDYVQAAAQAQVTTNLRQAQKQLLAPTRTDETNPILEMQYDIPNLPPMARSIIGEGPSTLRITGYGKITISGRSQYQTGQALISGTGQSRFPTLAMQQELAFQINGTIGSKVHVQIDQDTRRLTDLENSIRIRYQGEEDEIIKEVEIGNTNLSLSGPQFISGGRQQQGLFGIKTRAQLGDLELNVIASQQKSSVQKRTFRGGATETEMQIKDIDYIKGRFFYLDDSYRDQMVANFEALRRDPARTEFALMPRLARNIIDVEVYVAGAVENEATRQGCAYYQRMTDESGDDLDPAVMNRTYDELFAARQTDSTVVTGRWERLDESAYELFSPRGMGILQLKQGLTGTSPPLGVRITYENLLGETVIFPPQTDSTLVLKLIRYGSPSASNLTWSYEMRNIYDLGARDLDEDDFDLTIVHGLTTERAERPARSAKTYMQIMTLDAAGAGLTGQPDGQVDINAAKVNLYSGLVILPFLEPFQEAFDALSAEEQTGIERPDIYTTTNYTTLSQNSKYLFIATYKRASTRINLGFNILENSEVVKLNGARLTKNVDYTIEYLTGELRFLPTVADQIVQPNADLTVDYEINPIFKPDQETLLGMRALYRFGTRGQFGTTFMFSSERTSLERVRVGEEPTKMAIVGADAAYEFQPNWLTSALDALPLLTTDVPSSVRLEAEIAQSFPNLNTRGVGYIDDFEGSANADPVTIYRRNWLLCSPPVDPITRSALAQSDRGRFAWFNPIHERVRTSSIWANTSTSSSRPEDQYTEVMHVWFRPSGDNEAERSQSWGGVMRSFGQEGLDLQQTQYLEVWMRVGATPFQPKGEAAVNTYDDLSGGEAVLHIDIGDISENVFSSGIADHFLPDDLNNEDKIRNETFVDSIWSEYRGDGDLSYGSDDQGEDVGLDGCPDAYETGNGGCALIADPNAVDPNGDNWSYDNNGSMYDYGHINGTENNRDDGSSLPRPDSEDINGSGELDVTNDYTSYGISLDGLSRYIVSGTEEVASGFKLYRIPIRDLAVNEVDSIGSLPEFHSIRGMRLWVSGVQDTAAWVTFASIDFVGNDWQELPEEGQDFAIATVNSRDNANDYTFPPGVEPETDPTTGAERPEQSLVLEFDEIGPGETYRAMRDLVTSKDLTNYRRLRMYLHGPTDEPDTDWDHLAAFVRLGLDSSYYYELRVPRIYPGWDERNFIDVHLDSLTNLKLALEGDLMAGTDTVSSDGRMVVHGYDRGLGTRSLPSLAQVKKIQIGVTNLSDRRIRASRRGKPIQVWFDELRLEDVRNISGRAMRADASIRLADLVSLTAAGTRTEIGFGSLTDKRGATTQSQSVSLSMSRFRFDKFFPAEWSLSLPLTVNYSRTSSVPRLKQGSDIELVRDEDKDLERSTSSNLSADASFSRTVRSNNLLTNLTIDRISLGASYATSRRVTPTASSRDSSESESYSGRLGYDLSPRTRRAVRPFGWLGPIGPGWLTQTELEYLPSTLRFDTDARFTADSTRRQQVILGVDSTTVTVRQTFTMSENYRFMMRPLRSININYSLGINRDLKDAYEGNADPMEVLRAATNAIFREGESSRTQRLTTSYSPGWPSFLTHSYSFSNAYSDNAATTSSTSTAADRTYRVSSQRSYGVNSVTLRLQDILNRLAGRGGGGGGRTPGRPPTAPSGDTGGGSGGIPVIGPVAGFIAQHLENPSGRVAYAVQFSGSALADSLRPGWSYQVFGLGGDPDLESGTLGVTSTNRLTESLNWGVNSGVGLPFNMRLRGKYTFKGQRALAANDTTRSEEISFPDVTLTWDRLQEFPVLNLFAQRSDIQSAFLLNTVRRWKATSAIPERLEARTRSYTFNPLAAWTVMWKNSLRTTLRTNYEEKYADALGATLEMNTTRTTTWGITLAAGYELQTSRGISKPWGGVWRLDGNISLSMDASYGGSRMVAVGGNQLADGADLLKSDRISWSIKPRATYQFSRTFSGRAEVEVGMTDDRKTHRKTHVRALSVTGEIRFN